MAFTIPAFWETSSLADLLNNVRFFKRRPFGLDVEFVGLSMDQDDTDFDATPRRLPETSNDIGELRTDSGAAAAAPPVYTRMADSEQIDELTSLSTYGVVEPAKEAMEHMEISMDISANDNPHGLEVNSMVEIPGKKGKLYGVIRWMGHEARLGPMAGVELEDKLEGAGTDGMLLGKRYFTCDPNRALFVKLLSVKPDSRFPSQFETFTKRTRLTSDDFGGFKSPYVKGYIQPPTKLAPHFVGRRKGIQGDQNSCYLDTTLYSMYAYSNIFDAILKRQKQSGDLREFEGVQTTLREHIVNPLRSYGFVRADRVIDLRESLDKLGTTKGLTSEEKDPEEFLHTLLQEVTKTEPFLHIRSVKCSSGGGGRLGGGSLDKLGTTKGLTSEEKDPEEFLHTLLQEVTKTEPFLHIRHGDHVEKSYHYQIFMEKNESYSLPTVEQLLHYSFLHSDLKLTQPPPCLIMQMPRFGKDYRMYNRILPSLYLDISDLLEGWPRICTMCGQLAEYECRECSGQLAPVTDAINSYCHDCLGIVHKNRPNHKPKDVKLSNQFVRLINLAKEKEGWTDIEIHEKILAPRKMMELFAVVCIETSHYVAFVKAGTGPDAEWVFFDSMADREGDQQGYNIPEITHLRDFKQWLESAPSLLQKDDKELPPQLRRLLGDGYMCMYQDPTVVRNNLKAYPTATNIDEVMRNLEEIKESASAANTTRVDVTSAGASGYSREGAVTSGYSREGAVIGGTSVGGDASSSAIAGGVINMSNALSAGGITTGALGSQYAKYPQTHEYDHASRTGSRSAAVTTPSPAAAYSTQLGASRGSKGKAEANAAAVYRNYSDAKSATPGGQNTAMYPHGSASGSTLPQRTPRGTSNNAGVVATHEYTKPPTEYSRSTAYSKPREQQIAPDYRQHVGLPDDYIMDDNSERDSTYKMPLNSDADLYTRQLSTVNDQRQSKYENYIPVSQTNTTAAAVHIPPPAANKFTERYSAVGCSTRSDKLNRDCNPQARNGISSSSAAVGRTYVNGTSSAQDLSSIKHPPSQDDDDDEEMQTMFGGLSSKMGSSS